MELKAILTSYLIFNNDYKVVLIIIKSFIL